MAGHTHWFFVPHYDPEDRYFTKLKDERYMPQDESSPHFKRLRCIINSPQYETTVKSFKGIGPDDRVYLFGHSNGTEFGSHKVKYESGKLTDLLEQFNLPATHKVFKLFGCLTGVLVGNETQTLAEKFYRIAKRKFNDLIVYGYTGNVVLGKVEEHNKVYSACYKDPIKGWQPSHDYQHRGKDRHFVFDKAAFEEANATSGQLVMNYTLDKEDAWIEVVSPKGPEGKEEM